MESKKKFMSEMILSLLVPVVLINLVMAISCAVILCPNILNNSGTKQNIFELLIIFGLGLGFIVGVLYFSIKKIAKLRVEQLLKERSLTRILDRSTQLARKIVEGEYNRVDKLDLEREASSEIENYLNHIMQTEHSIHKIIKEISEKTNQGYFEQQLEDNGYIDKSKELVCAINQILKNASDKIFWYESVIDAIPYPVHVLDLNGIEIHMNIALEDYLAETGQYPNREAAYGLKSCEAKLEICNSPECPDDCSVKRLLSEGLTETDFFFEGMYGKMNTAYIRDKTGKKVGIMEISADITPSMSVNDFTRKEIERLEENLFRLVEGDLQFDMEISAGNAYTSDVYAHFQSIGRSLELVKKSIGNLIEDGTMLTDSVLKGNLDAVADQERFKGSWKMLITGMNRILSTIAKPIQEVSDVMDSIAKGSLTQFVSGSYEGEFKKLKESVNNTTINLKGVMKQITDVTSQIGRGNLNIPVISDFQGEFSEISGALNQIVGTLNTLLCDVNMAAEQVAVGSNQVSDSSQSLAQGATEQASSIQELTASIIEISEQTKSNAVNANAARERTNLVRENAENGNHKMADMQQSMKKINESSTNISKIIKVIDDIAFQTNILALNAAVEAARAGQHGKGFAVVAEEVRTLAARSADAAKETTFLIEDSIDNVKAGTQIADETAIALTEIVDEINKVTDLMENIAEASSEQATGIAQINLGIDMVGQVVQQNSATAEETAAASEELSGQAQVLQEMIGQFELRLIGTSI